MLGGFDGRRVALALTAAALAAPVATAGAQTPAPKPLTIVFVVDGLRPDSINPTDTPNLYRLSREGTLFTNNHSIVPTVTRGNATGIGSGAHPEHSGILGNAMFVPEVNPLGSFSTGDAAQLLKLDEVTGGKIVLTETLAERVQAAGKTLLSLGSGTSGATLLLNPKAPHGVGQMVNTGDANTPFAFPTALGTDILARFGTPPRDGGTPNNKLVTYAETVLRDGILTPSAPDVVLNWITEPDGSQHSFGVGSPQALSGIRNSDKELGLVLEKAQALGRRTNVLVASDHGFSLRDYNVNVTSALEQAGLRTPGTDDTIVSNTGPALIHVKGRNPDRIAAIVRFLQSQPWASTVYTAAEKPVGGVYTVSPGDHDIRTVKPYGWVAGTFSLELIHQSNPVRGADIIVTFPWSSKPNNYGVPGRAAFAGGGTTGPVTGVASEHGSFSPWETHNTLLAWGPDVKAGHVVGVPVGNVDIAPTVLALAGIDDGKSGDGRVLTEALVGGEEPQVPYGARIFRTKSGNHDAAVQVSNVGGTWYVDKAWADDTQTEPAGGTEVKAPGSASGTVPATLSLALGAPASFDPFVPGVEREYTATTDATVVSSAADATLSVSEPGHLTNGAFSLPEPLRVAISKAEWTGPVSNERVDITFKQLVKAGDALRTGTYAKTLTFTLATSRP
ncbi:alkaline phosphatase family protein [Solirubrobacter phytolaccae]|uniref:Alkaline phosphatase family protein n=1 Tax=Solirubrobacter phytolaccae TaxID=1404360 RepID=A0A9X3S906_9ACTN|nr:alkaline phosphatase family protein [Solirubrobacter phytolaccae]MDA0178700.1 alkaline phosphatase family protein [Solirubrobacter phytolaccae]